MTKQQIDFVRDCIANKDMHAFYTWTPWEKIRLDALKQVRVPALQSQRQIYQGNHRASCEPCQAASRVGLVALV